MSTIKKSFMKSGKKSGKKSGNKSVNKSVEKTLPTFFGHNNSDRQVNYETLAIQVANGSGRTPSVEEMQQACFCMDIKLHEGVLLDNPSTEVWTTFFDKVKIHIIDEAAAKALKAVTKAEKAERKAKNIVERLSLFTTTTQDSTQGIDLRTHEI